MKISLSGSKQSRSPLSCFRPTKFIPLKLFTGRPVVVYGLYHPYIWLSFIENFLFFGSKYSSNLSLNFNAFFSNLYKTGSNISL